EVTQPQGHSTSGSHERYKSKDRLAWEAEYDCLVKMREWMLSAEVATADQLDQIENEAKEAVRQARSAAWSAFADSIKEDHEVALKLMDNLAAASEYITEIATITEELRKTGTPIRSDAVRAVRKALRYVRDENNQAKRELVGWLEQTMGENADRF